MKAENLKKLILTVLAAVGSFVAKVLGGWDHAMILLVALMAADYITGLLVALVWKKSPKTESGAASSIAGFKGLLKKGMVLLVVWVAVLLDKALGVDYVRLMAILFFSGNEGLSLIENLGIMGLPFPAFVKKMFEVLQEKGNEGKGDVSHG